MNDHKVTVDTPITGVVLGIEEQMGSYGPNYKIALDTGTGHFTVLEQKARFDKQFQERGVSRDTIIGRTIKIWKRPMPDDPKKGYLNVDLLDTGRAETPIKVPVAVDTMAGIQPTTLPPWLDKEAKEGQIKEQARADLDWAWNVAWGIMEPKIIGIGGAMADPLTLQAIQAAAVALTIRLEHTRR